MGPPASGKSSFCENHLVPHGYVRVNRDTLGTAAKCMKVSTIGKIMSCSSGLEIRLFSMEPDCIFKSYQAVYRNHYHFGLPADF